jgi:hypothetical protein
MSAWLAMTAAQVAKATCRAAVQLHGVTTESHSNWHLRQRFRGVTCTTWRLSHPQEQPTRFRICHRVGTEQSGVGALHGGCRPTMGHLMLGGWLAQNGAEMASGSCMMNAVCPR